MSNITLVIIPVWLLCFPPSALVLHFCCCCSNSFVRWHFPFFHFMSGKQVYFVLSLLGRVHFKVKGKKKKNNTHKNTGSPSAPRDPLHSCFSHQRLPDKWVHQGEHWDVVSRMGHVARARVRASMCHLTMCKCVILLVYGLWQRWWVSLSSLIAAPADGLRLWQEEKSVGNLTPGSAAGGGGRRALYTKLTICLDKTQEVAYIVPTSNLNSNIGWLVDQTFSYWGEWSKYHSVQPGGNDYTHHW